MGNTFLGASTLPVTQQIDQHLASSYVTAGQFAATDLVIVMAGANDVFTQAGLAGAGAIASTAAGTAVGTAAGALATQVSRIKAAGAKHVVVVGLPDMGVNPYASASGAAAAGALTSLSQAVFNATLKGGLTAVPGVAYLDPVPLRQGSRQPGKLWLYQSGGQHVARHCLGQRRVWTQCDCPGCGG